MSTFCRSIPSLLLSAILLAAPLPSLAQAPGKPDTAVRPLVGKEPPFCEACGTVVAIKRVAVEAVPKDPAAKAGSRDRYEVVVRLDAGTQQVVRFDVLPKLKIGQKVRITNGVIVPELA